MKRTAIEDLKPSMVGERVILRARLQNKRESGNKLTFLELRQKIHTVQALVCVDETMITKQMVKFVNGINPESLILIEATVAAPLESIKSCTVHDVELKIEKLHIESDAARLPFSLEDATRSDLELENDPTLSRVALDTRLNNRIIDLRV
jgi:aspartyl/asparaginyl-tRNA synthetase